MTRKREDAAHKIKILAQNLGFDQETSVTKDTQHLYRQVVGARDSTKGVGNGLDRLLVVSGFDVVAGCCLWIICRKTQQLTKQKDIAAALSIDVSTLRKKLKLVEKLLDSQGWAAQYRAVPVPATGHVTLVVSKLVPPKHSNKIRLRIAALTTKVVTLAEQGSIDTGRHREPLVVAAAILALRGYLDTELNDTESAAMYGGEAEEARQKAEATLKELRGELNPKTERVADLFGCSKGVLAKRIGELKDMLLEVAFAAGLDCSVHNMNPHLIYLIDNAANYQDMMTITPDVDAPPPTLGGGGGGGGSSRVIGGNSGGGGAISSSSSSRARGNGKKKVKVLDPLGAPPSFEASKRRRIAESSRRAKLVDVAVAQRAAAAAAADEGGAAEGRDASADALADDVTNDGEQVTLLVKLLKHGYTRDQLLHADLDNLHTVVSPVVVQEGEELTDADLPASEIRNYIRTDAEVTKLAEQKEKFKELAHRAAGDEAGE